MSDPSMLAIAEAVSLEPWLTAAPASVVLQMVSVARLRGAMRGISIILACMTGVLCALAVAAYAMDPGNLWQIVLLMTARPVLVLTVGTLLMGLILNPRRSQQHLHYHA
jgi:Na+-driven multidrug efflux pump